MKYSPRPSKLNGWILKISVALLLALGASCSDDNPPLPGAVLLDNEWEYVETRALLNENSALPLPFDGSLLQQILDEDNNPPPQGGALAGSRILFEDSGDVLALLPDADEFASFGTTFLIQDEQIVRMKIKDSIWFQYEYLYNDTDGSLTIAPKEETADALMSLINAIFSEILLTGGIDSIASKITSALFNDPRVSEAIGDWLYDGIRGKLDEIPEQAPEDIARSLAEAITSFLIEQDLADELEQSVAARLKELTTLDPDTTAGQMAEKIAGRVAEIFSEENIYQAILPRLEAFDERDPGEIAQDIAQVIYQAMTVLLAEERLAAVVASAWQEFSETEEEQISQVADEVATVVIDNWLNAETFSAAVYDTALLIDSTPLNQMSQLADQAVASLQVTVDDLNDRFPELNLDPPWLAIRGALLAAFTAAKPLIATKGVQQVADEVGASIAETYFSHAQLQGLAETALLALQQIDPPAAGQAIGGWIAALIEAEQTPIVDSLEARLEVVLANFEAERAAAQIAKFLHEVVTSRLSEEALYELLYPLMEALVQIDPELGAAWLADVLKQSQLLDPELIEEKIYEMILPIAQELLPLDREALAAQLVQLIQESELVDAVFTPERIENVISFLLYRRVLESSQSESGIEGIEMELKIAE